MTNQTMVKIKRKLVAASGALGLTMGAALMSMDAFATCSYSVTDEWTNGFNAAIRLTNTTNAAINGWNVQWQYAGNNRVTNAWNSTLSGNNPYSASNFSWNGVIQPNQFVDLGIQGTKSAGAAEIPTLSGGLCEEIDPGSVYLQVDKADDHLFVYVDGVEKMRWSAPDSARTYDSGEPTRIGEKIDITHLLSAGENEIKIVAAADNWYSLSGGYDVRLWQGTNLLIDANQDFSFGDTAFAGILFSDSVTIDMDNAGPRRTLTLNSANGGEAIYINNMFTGKYVPATFELASGEYRVGLGESNSPPAGTNSLGELTGQFRELDIVVSGQDVTLDATQLPVIDEPNEWKVAVIPYTEVHFGLTNAQADAGVSAAPNNIGVLTNDDIEVATAVVHATSDQLLMPFSYGLMKWDVTVLPAVTERVYRTDSFRWDPSMVDENLAIYDMVIHVIANRTLMVNGDGHRMIVVNDIAGYGYRPDAYIPQSWLNAEGDSLSERLQNVLPSSGMLHESLHTYDNYRLNDYNGVEQVHGAEEHGYNVQDCDFQGEWLCWYRGYIRSQIGENTSTLNGVASSVKLSGQDVDTYVGVFNVMRGGRTAEQLWTYRKPASRIQNNNTLSCLDVAGSDIEAGAEILPWSCHSGDNQLWALHEIQNSGVYHLVNQHSGKCADFFTGGLSQQVCAAHSSQRFMLGTLNNGAFPIKSLSGECMTQSSSGELILESCSESAPSQYWKLN